MDPVWQPTQADINALVDATLIAWALACQFVVAALLVLRWGRRGR